MKTKIEEFVHEKFMQAPKSKETKDLRDEITSNMLERYKDYVDSGEEEEAAFEKTIMNFGDIETLIESEGFSPQFISKMNSYREKRAKLFSVATAFLVLSNVGGYMIHGSNLGSSSYLLGQTIFWLFIALAFGSVAYLLSSRDGEVTAFYRAKSQGRFKRNASLLIFGIVLFLFIQTPFSNIIWIALSVTLVIYFLVKKVKSSAQNKSTSIYNGNFSADIEEKSVKHKKQSALLITTGVVILILSNIVAASLSYGVFLYWIFMALAVAIFTYLLFGTDLEVIEYKNYQKQQMMLRLEGEGEDKS